MRNRIAILVVLLVFAFIMGASAQTAITVKVNGSNIVSDTPAVITNGSTMLPLRAVSNALGVKDADIQWNESSKSIEIRSEGKYIFLAVGAMGAIVDDGMVTLNAAPYIQNGRTMVPVRFVSEAMGANVDWDNSTKTVSITKK